VLTQGNNQYQSLKATVEKPLPELKVADVTDQREMRDVLLEGVTELKRQLATRDQIERNSKRVNELKKEESLHAKDLSELEKTEFTIESFQKTKMLMVEQAVNDKFTIVKFKLYETLVTGGERQVFETMVNGVPFSDANRADQINAGIDIINALSKHYGISVPIIIDNAEAVNQFIPTEAQTILLYVTTDKTLKIT